MNDKKQNIGIPYMGSKRKLAADILNKITSRHPNMTDFYDLFGGGGSISFTAIRDYRFKTHYNELNKHIYSLVEYLKNNKTLDDRFYEWVTRDVFFEQIGKTNAEADWYSGFVMSCWSFGNKQTSYLYGAEIETVKKQAHEFVVHGCIESMNKIGIDIPSLLEIKGISNRRIAFCKHMKEINKQQGEYRIQNLEYLEHLSRIQNLQNLQITNKSYEKVEITGNNPVIYCDIPYIGTGEYKEGGFDHDALYKWASEIEHPVYVSEYTSPFQKIEMFKHRSSLSATNNKKKTFESIFWNGKGDVSNYKLF